MNLAFQIVPIAEEHIQGFWAAVDSVAREREYLASFEGPPIESTRGFVLESLRTNRPHFVALLDSNVVGWCDITPKRFAVHAHVGVLGMGVLAEFRRKSIGKALIASAIAKAGSIGLTRIELTVRDENRRAIALYEQVGFIVEGRKKNATRIDGVYSDDLCMALLVPQK